MFKLLCCAVLALLISLLILLLIKYYLSMNNSTNNNQVQSYSASNKESISIPHVKNPFNVPTFYIVYGDGKDIGVLDRSDLDILSEIIQSHSVEIGLFLCIREL